MMKQQKESVNGIIFSQDRNQLLLTKRCDIPVWALPGGGVELNETPEQAMIREMHEETGYHVTCSRKIAKYSFCKFYIFPCHEVHLYECHILAGTPTLSNETQEIRFFPLNALPSILFYLHANWIKDAIPIQSHLINKNITHLLHGVVIKFFILHPKLSIQFCAAKIKLKIFNHRK